MADARVVLRSVADVLRTRGLLVEVLGSEDTAVSGVCQDSRRVRPGDLFLAWQGTEHDAHEFVAAAADGGAVAAIVERHLPDVAIPHHGL